MLTRKIRGAAPRTHQRNCNRREKRVSMSTLWLMSYRHSSHKRGEATPSAGAALGSGKAHDAALPALPPPQQTPGRRGGAPSRGGPKMRRTKTATPAASIPISLPQGGGRSEPSPPHPSTSGSPAYRGSPLHRSSSTEEAELVLKKSVRHRRS